MVEYWCVIWFRFIVTFLAVPKSAKWVMTQEDEKLSVHKYAKEKTGGTSLVAQWLRIRLPMQGTWVQALVQEDPTCHGATKPVSHNY